MKTIKLVVKEGDFEDPEGLEWLYGEYVIKAPLYGDKIEIIEKSTSSSVKAGQDAEMSISPAKYQLYQVISIFRSAPFEVNEENIKKMPEELADAFMEEADGLKIKFKGFNRKKSNKK